MPSTWPAESFRVRGTLLVAGGAVGIILVTLFVSGIALRATGAISATPAKGLPLPVGPLLFVQLLFYIVVGAYLFFALPPLAQRTLAQLGLRAPRGSDIVTGFVGALVMLVVVYIASLFVQLLSHHEQEQTVIQMFRALKDPALLVFFGATAVALAPFIEELVFRCFLFNAFSVRPIMGLVCAGTALALVYAFNHLNLVVPAAGLLAHWGVRETLVIALIIAATTVAIVYFGSPARAGDNRARIALGALCSGIIFGVAHGEVFTILPLAAGGMVLALTYYRSGNLWSSIVTHACFNTVQLIGVIATNAPHVSK